MCLSPITIINPTKYVNVKYNDRFLLQVPCNECAECSRNFSNEWTYRTLFEFYDLLSQNPNNYVYFDTLTYAPEALPYLSDIDEHLPHVPCFRTKDITLFMKRLRTNLDRKCNLSKIRFFLCSEYGSKFYRPHYHILLFCPDSIDPIKLSYIVSESWAMGRTDGVPFRSSGYVMMHNVVKPSCVGDILSVAGYVVKYVQKDCHLQKMLDRTIKKCDIILASDQIPFVKSNSVAASRLRQKIKTEVNQFHLQSLHFGEGALADIDLNQIEEDGYLLMPSKDNIRIPIRIPTYYLRKIYYDKVVVDKTYAWQLNDDGIRYKERRDKQNLRILSSRFRCAAMLKHLDIDSDALADYVLHKRGRYISPTFGESLLEDRVKNPSHYIYATRSDKEAIGCGVSFDFVGNSSIGYSPLVNFVKIRDFIAQHVYLDDEKEAILKQLYDVLQPINQGKQEYFSRVQELTALYKEFI